MLNWNSEIDRISAAFAHEFQLLSPEQLNWKPNPDTWSIAQNIDHLMVTNRTYFPVLQKLKEGTYRPPFMAKIGFMVSFLGKTILKAVAPDRKRKMKTFTIWQPANSQLPGDILSRYQEHQQELKAQITAAEPLIQKGTVISSPANKNIVYKLETAFDIIVRHEERHLEQAREVLGLLHKK